MPRGTWDPNFVEFRRQKTFPPPITKTDKLTSNIRARKSHHKRQPRRADRARTQADTKQEAQPQLPGPRRRHLQQRRKREAQDPQIQRQVGAVREVPDGDQVQTRARAAAPPRLHGAALEPEDELQGEDPRGDEAGGREDHDAEIGRARGHENAEVEGEHREFGGRDGNVVEVAKDVVGLLGNQLGVSNKLSLTAYWGRAIP